MRLLIIDQCSGSKAVLDGVKAFDANEIDAASRDELLDREGVPAIPAQKLYDGRQQRYIDSAVDQLREVGDTVDRYYVSAGFGVVDERTELPPYNVTFAEMTSSEIDDRASDLGIADDIVELVTPTDPYDIVVFALGTDYYRACDITRVLDAFPETTTGVVFNREEDAAKRANVVSVPARTEQADEYGSIVVALKGVYLTHFAGHRNAGTVPVTPAELKELFLTDPMEQTGLSDF